MRNLKETFRHFEIFVPKFAISFVQIVSGLTAVYSVIQFHIHAHCAPCRTNVCAIDDVGGCPIINGDLQISLKLQSSAIKKVNLQKIANILKIFDITVISILQENFFRRKLFCKQICLRSKQRQASVLKSP